MKNKLSKVQLFIHRYNMNTKGKFIYTFYRFSNFFTKNSLLKIIGILPRLLYKIIVEWILGVEIPDQTKIGRNLNVFHGQGLVVNVNSIIGDNVILRHNTTIGNAVSGGGCPTIEDDVNIGANCVVVGHIRIGRNSTIGAGSVVVRDIPDNAIAVGNPARVIKMKTDLL